MSRNQIIGFSGAAIIIAGVFAPIFHVPVTGSINYYHEGAGDGIIILLLAVLSLLLLLAKKYKGLWFTGFASLGMISYTFITITSAISDMEAFVTANAVVQIKWGWIFLILGAALLIVSAALRERVDQ